MPSRAEEEVRKRRAKGRPGSPKVYPKLVLLGGVISVLLAIGLSPGMAPMLSAGIIGVTVLLFFWLKNQGSKERAEEETGSPEEAPAPEEKVVDLNPIHSETQERELLFEKELEDPAKAANIPKIFSENKAKVSEEVSAQKAGGLQESVYRIEGRVAALEAKLANLEEKMAAAEELGPRPDDKVDLQKIFSQMDEKEAESAKPQRSYLVQTEIPTP